MAAPRRSDHPTWQSPGRFGSHREELHNILFFPVCFVHCTWQSGVPFSFSIPSLFTAFFLLFVLLKPLSPRQRDGLVWSSVLETDKPKNLPRRTRYSSHHQKILLPTRALRRPWTVDFSQNKTSAKVIGVVYLNSSSTSTLLCAYHLHLPRRVRL